MVFKRFSDIQCGTTICPAAIAVQLLFWAIKYNYSVALKVHVSRHNERHNKSSYARSHVLEFARDHKRCTSVTRSTFVMTSSVLYFSVSLTSYLVSITFSRQTVFPPTSDYLSFMMVNRFSFTARAMRDCNLKSCILRWRRLLQHNYVVHFPHSRLGLV